MKLFLLSMLTAIVLLAPPLESMGQAPDLAGASGFALFTSVGAFNVSGAGDVSSVTGDVGTNAGAFYGFPPGLLDGQKHVEDAISLQASQDLAAAYAALSLLSGSVLGVTLGGGQTITPGIYDTGAAASIGGELILDGEGDPDALFIIKIGGALTTGTYSTVTLINGASSSNVYWHIDGAFSLGDYSIFRGIILANGQIELLEGSTLEGQGLSIAGAILLHSNNVSLNEVVAPIKPTIYAEGDTLLCAGDSVILSGNVDGTWNTGETTPSITVFETGDYFVTNSIDSVSITSDTIHVTVNPVIIANADLIHVNCLGESTGSLTLTFSGGTPPYLVNFNDGGFLPQTSPVIYDELMAGTYSWVIQDAVMCEISGSETITQSTDSIDANAGPDKQLGCLVTEVVLEGSSETEGVSFLWEGPGIVSGGDTPTPLVNVAGTYTLTVTEIETGCSASDAAEVLPGGEVPVLVLNDGYCVFLTEEGKWTLNASDIAQITAGSSVGEGGSGELIFTFSRRTFDCADVYPPYAAVEVSATDADGCVTTGTFNLMVLDTLPPVAKCRDITVYLDAFGQVLVVAGYVNDGGDRENVPEWAKYYQNLEGGSFDNCGIYSMDLSKELYNYNDIGQNNVILTVSDESMNMDQCTAVITVLDTIVPFFTPIANITKMVEPGVCTTEIIYPEVNAQGSMTLSVVRTTGLGAEGAFPLGTTLETWKATSLSGSSVYTSFTVTITTYNAPPTLASVADVTVNEDAARFEIALSGIGYGIDCGAQQVTSLEVANSNPGLLIVEKEYVNGATSGKLFITPLTNKSGEATITLTVKDNGGTANGGVDTTVKSFKVTVSALNDAPTVTPIADQMITLPGSLSLNIASSFHDMDEGDVLTFSVMKSNGSVLPSWMTFSPSTGLLTGTPAMADLGFTEIKVIATDQSGATVQDVFLVVVLDPQATTLNVTAAKGTTPLTSGFDVVLFIKDGVFYNVIANTPVFSSGTTTFYNLTNGTYLAKAVITDALVNPGVMNTYYESATSVTAATPVVISVPSAKSILIKMVTSTLMAGDYKIMGAVVRKNGNPELGGQNPDPVSTPAAGVDMVLKQNGMVVANTVTGADGKYSFAGLPAGEYDVFVEVPGYFQTIVQKVTVNEANPLRDKVNFTIWTSDSVHVITQIVQTTNEFQMVLYPNPTSGKVTIDLTWNDLRYVDISVSNILGAQVFQSRYNAGELISFDLAEKGTGIYLVKMVAEGRTIVKKLTLKK